METLTCSPPSKSVAMTTKEIPSADEDRVISLKTQRLNGNLTHLIFFILSANDLTVMIELCPTLYICTFKICILIIFLQFFYINEGGGGLSFMSQTFEKISLLRGKNIKITEVPLQPFRVKSIDPSLQLFTGCLCHSFITGSLIQNQFWKVQHFKDLPPVTVTTVCPIRSSWTLKYVLKTG